MIALARSINSPIDIAAAETRALSFSVSLALAGSSRSSMTLATCLLISFTV